MIGGPLRIVVSIRQCVHLAAAGCFPVGLALAFWTLRPLSQGPKSFVHREAPIWIPFIGIFAFLSYYEWPLDLRIVCAIPIGSMAGLFWLAALRPPSSH